MQTTLKLYPELDTKVLIVSDTHLLLPITRELSIVQKSLIDRIDRLSKARHAVLVLNGDIFELWEATQQSVEDIIDGFEELTHAIQKFTQGRGHKVIYIVGNHDDRLAESPTDRAVVESRWGVEFGMTLQLVSKKRKIIIQHGHQYDPYSIAHNSKDARGKKLVQKTIPILQTSLPSLFSNIDSVVDRSFLIDFLITNFIFRLYLPLICPLVLLMGLLSSAYFANWMIMLYSVMILVLSPILMVAIGALVRLFSGNILGGGSKYFKRIDKTQLENRAKIVILGHTHQGGIYKRAQYTYANSGCNDVIAKHRIGRLGLVSFDHSLQLSSIMIDYSKKQILEYYQQNLPLVE